MSSCEPVVLSPTAGAVLRSAPRVGPWLQHILLLVFVVATRAPLIGNFEGEPDSARYVTGVHLWISGDRGNHLIYEKGMSAGYYWFTAELAKVTHTSLQHYALMLSIVSLCAAVLMTPVLYELSRRLVGDNAGFVCCVLFLLSPAIWWLGLEPHPQIVSIALALSSLWAYSRAISGPGWFWWVVSAITMIFALLVRSDTVLLFPACAGLLLFVSGWDRHTTKKLLISAAMLAVASGLFLLFRGIILRTSLSQLQADSNESLGSCLGAPAGMAIVSQAMPVVLALGPALFAFAAAGVLCLTRASALHRNRWLVLLACWSVPGWLFWFFLICGNGPRHVAVLDLPLLWAGVQGWSSIWGDGKTATVAAVAAVLNFGTIPANSNVTIMSPNVPGSFLALRHREEEIRRLAEKAVAAGGSSCFVGTYTVPYFRLYAVQASRPSDSRLEEDARGWTISSERYSIFCPSVASRAKIRMPCSRAYSLEYTPSGDHLRYFGAELYRFPLWVKLAGPALRANY